jgi:nucleoid DNA-binding protein
VAKIYLTDLAAEAAKALEISPPFAREIVRTTLNLIGLHLIAGDEIEIAGHGAYRCKRVKARTLTNPRTGQRDIHVPESRCPSWKPSPLLKAKVRTAFQPRAAAPRTDEHSTTKTESPDSPDRVHPCGPKLARLGGAVVVKKAAGK